MTEANATLEYETYDYSLPHSKTVDLIGEEFIKKENGGVQTPSWWSSAVGSDGFYGAENDGDRVDRSSHHCICNLLPDFPPSTHLHNDNHPHNLHTGSFW